MVDVKGASSFVENPHESPKQQALAAATAALVTFAEVLFRGVVKLSLTAGTTEIIRLPFVLAS